MNTTKHGFSGICAIAVGALYAVNNLPRDSEGDVSSTVTVFDISGRNAEQPIEIDRIELPMPLGTFVNNRNIL